MILDRGICTIYAVTDTAAPGDAPNPTQTMLCQSWYGELSFETGRTYEAGTREDVQTDNRVRVLQDRRINNRCLAEVDGTTYRITRAYHGIDQDSGQLITDLSLEVVNP